MPADFSPGLLLAVTLVAAIVGGYLAKFLHLPRVIGYILVGVGLKFLASGQFGTHAAGEMSGPLRLVTELTLGLILFTIGGVFEARRITSIKATLAKFSSYEILGTFLCTTLGCFAATWTIPGMTFAHALTVGLLLGSVGIATAPAATYLVLREYEAKGPSTNHVLGMTGINNLVSIVAFGMTLMLCTWLGWIEPKHISGPLWLDLLFVSIGSAIIGAFLGVILSLLHSRLALPEMILVFFAAIFMLSTLDDYLKQNIGTAFNPMVTCLVMGAVFENLALDPRNFEQTLETVSLPLFAVFFVLAGYNLHIEELAHIGWLGAAYVLMRTAGKVGGVWLAAGKADSGTMVPKTAGLGLLCQAGVAIGLGEALREHWNSDLADNINTVILSSVTLYEMSGPLLLKSVAVRSGEVKVLTLLRPGQHSTQGGPTAVILGRIVQLLFPSRPKESTPANVTLSAQKVMRTNVRCLAGAATLNEVLRFVEGSWLHDFPVVDPQRRYLGTIHFNSIRDLVYDPTFAYLVTAIDLADETAPVARLDTPLTELLELFSEHNQGALAIIDGPETKKFLGIVEQRDVLRALHRTFPEAAKQEARRGVLFIGAGPVARALALEIKATHPVKLMDTNKEHCEGARQMGLEAVHGNALKEDGLLGAGVGQMHAVVSLTPNDEVNLLSARSAREQFRVPECFVLLTQDAGRITEVPGATRLFESSTDLPQWEIWITQGQFERQTVTAEGETSAGELLARAKVQFSGSLLPLAVERNAERSVYRPKRRMREGDSLIVLEHFIAEVRA